MSGSAEHTVDVAEHARHQLKSALVEGWDERGQRVQSMQTFARISAQALHELRGLDLGPSDALLDPIARAQQRFRAELDEARSILSRAHAVARGMGEFLQGPSRYLLLAANNAEMRAGSGMILNVGTVFAANGHLVQESMDPTAQLALPPGDVVIQPGD